MADTGSLAEDLASRVQFLNRRGEALSREGSHAAAKDALTSAHNLAKQIDDESQRNEQLAATLHNLGCAHSRCKEHSKAVAFLEAASRIEKAASRESPVTLINLSNALMHNSDLPLAKATAEGALTVAELVQPDALAVAYFQLAVIETELVFAKSRDSERAVVAQRALLLFHQAGQSPGGSADGFLGSQILQATRAARLRFQKAGLAQLGAAPPPQVPKLPTLAPRATARRHGPYATQNASDVQRTTQQRSSPSRDESAPQTHRVAGGASTTPVRPLPPSKKSGKSGRRVGRSTDRDQQRVVTHTAAETARVPARAGGLTGAKLRHSDSTAGGTAASELRSLPLPPITAHRHHQHHAHPHVPPPHQQHQQQQQQRTLVPALLWTLPALYGLQSLMGAAERKRSNVPALHAVYRELRASLPLMPRFDLKTASKPKLGVTKSALRGTKSFLPSQLIAIDLMRKQNELPLLRLFFGRWSRTLPQFRRSKPLRRAAAHLQQQNRLNHLRSRWADWVGDKLSKSVSRKSNAAAASLAVSSKQPSAPPTPEKSPLELLMNRWLQKMTPAWQKVDEDREKYDEATIKDDVARLNEMKRDFASALSTCFEKHRHVPLVAPEKLAQQVESLLSLIISDAVESTESSTLLASLFMNLPGVDLRTVCEKCGYVATCAADGHLQYLVTFLDAFGDEPADGWVQCMSEALYDDANGADFISLALKYPQAFPIGKVAQEFAPHWQQFIRRLTATTLPDAPEHAKKIALVVQLLLHDGVAFDLLAEDDDHCDLLNRAAKHADVELVKALIDDVHVSVDSRTSQGLTPLGQAVLSNSFDVVEALLDRGASTRTLYNGMTPLEMAEKLGQDARIINLLAEAHKDDHGPVALAVRKSFVSTPVDATPPNDDREPREGQSGQSMEHDVEAFDDEELGVADLRETPRQNGAAEGGDAAADHDTDDVLSFSAASSTAVEAQLRNEAIDAFEADSAPFAELEIAPADAPRRRVMRDVNGAIFVADRVSDSCALASVTRIRESGYVFIAVAGKPLLLDELLDADESKRVSSDHLSLPARFELLVLDNGHVALCAVDADGKLVEPDLAIPSSALKLVSDDEASSFSEFIFTTTEQGHQDQTFLEAMLIGQRRESESAKARRREERKRAARLKIVQQFFGEDFAENSFVLGPVDVDGLRLTFDSLSTVTALATEEDSPMAQHVVVDKTADNFISVRLREARHQTLAALSGEDSDGAIMFVPDAEYLWEVVELADGNMALESHERPGWLLEIKLDTEPHTLGLVAEDESSSFCEIAIRAATGLHVPLPDAVISPGPDADRRIDATESEPLSPGAADDAKLESAATAIQKVVRGHQARKRVTTKRDQLDHGGAKPAGPAELRADISPDDTGTAPRDEGTSIENDAALKIQTHVRRRQATNRVKQYRAERERQRAAAIKIQCAERRRQAVKRADGKRRQNNGVVTTQFGAKSALGERAEPPSTCRLPLLRAAAERGRPRCPTLDALATMIQTGADAPTLTSRGVPVEAVAPPESSASAYETATSNTHIRSNNSAVACVLRDAMDADGQAQRYPFLQLLTDAMGKNVADAPSGDGSALRTGQAVRVIQRAARMYLAVKETRKRTCRVNEHTKRRVEDEEAPMS